MEFTPIESQEQFDAMVKERLDRKEKSVRKEFETQLKDLESFKSQVTEKETEITALRQKIADMDGENKTKEESYQSMQKELSKVKLDALKQRIAREAGLPYEMADRLNGEDEESIRSDAEAVKGLMGSHKVAPSFNNETATTDPTDAGYRAMAQMFERK